MSAVIDHETYLERLEDLYSKVVAWVREMNSEAEFLRVPRTIREGDFQYEADILEVCIPGMGKFSLVPRGCRILGAEGRVDLEGPGGSEALVLREESGSPLTFKEITETGRVIPRESAVPSDHVEGWHFVQNTAIGYLPVLDKDLFIRLLAVLSK
ncbi:MAG: hypothetical protein HUU16_11615 [Candidatus Omnitrophica bacterium]|nr:hypothetical protein [bacterium]NUN96811.1 hypothetical protein [Candidatus Omnitrophota bacterium]